MRYRSGLLTTSTGARPIKQIRLEVSLQDLVGPDQLTLTLNGQSIADESCHRGYLPQRPYVGQRLNFILEKVRPKKGRNVLEISLDKRPPRVDFAVTISDVKLVIEYGPYQLNRSSS